MTAPIHAAMPGIGGNHRTDTTRCPCLPWQMLDLNEPGRIVVVHRPYEPGDADRSQRVSLRGDSGAWVPSSSSGIPPHHEKEHEMTDRPIYRQPDPHLPRVR